MRRYLAFVTGPALALGGAWVVAVGATGAWMTRLGPWYRSLDKPDWQPPDWLFGPVWTLIFGLAATTFVLAWSADGADAGVRAALLAAWCANGVLNVAWSYLFFRRERPDWALRETAGLAASVLVMMIVAAPHAGAATWLLAPYLGWICFAFVLNLAIVRRNGPFGG